ncbi:M50 family metallopeptidase [Anaerobacillus sp. MEB173]|uniref:M50 family metallopeptidase n=1 Tax=Anaerobacillus sp. MEB173 TaxID=3383345 RepID=UPI003F92030F
MDIIYYLIAAFIICHVPVIRRIACTVNTLIHESGHAIAAILTSGKVYSVSLFVNSEGVAETGTRSWFSRLIVSYAGYTTSSLAAFVCFFFIYKDQPHVIFYGLLGLAILNLLLWVRNTYGILWLLTFISFSIYITYNDFSSLQLSFTLLLASIILIHSISSAFTVFYLSIFQSTQAGDATNLAKLTFLPAVLWGLLFFIQSLVSSYFIFSLFLL